MRALAVNGSPRKKWNTARLLESALAGAACSGLDTEIVHLYDHAFQGCTSCFRCKRIGGKSYGHCAMRDELTPILERVSCCDVLVLGSPLYWQTETAGARAFIERLVYPYAEYTRERGSLAPKRIPVGLVYTMNVKEEDLPSWPQHVVMESTREILAHYFGSCETFVCADTYQFRDYSRYVSSAFDAAAKTKRREEVFPLDCARAFDLGLRLATTATERMEP
jgi:multimeric flavodoxin WrbA